MATTRTLEAGERMATMRKNLLYLVLTGFLLILVLASCGQKEQQGSEGTQSSREEQSSQASQEAGSGRIISPMPAAVSMDDLTNCTFAAEFTAADVYQEDGSTKLRLKVCVADIYDVMDVTTMKVGDSIVLGGETVKVSTLSEDGSIQINGGRENGGYTLAPDSGGVYSQLGENGGQVYTVLGEAVLTIGEKFRYKESGPAGSETEANPRTLTEKDFVAEMAGGSREFTGETTKVTVQQGKVLEIRVRAGEGAEQGEDGSRDTADSGESAEFPAQPTTIIALAAGTTYDSLLEAYRKAIQEKWDAKALAAAGLSTLCSFDGAGGESAADAPSLGYLLLNVLGDEKPELLIGNMAQDSDKAVYDLYTREGDTVKHVLSSSADRRFYLEAITEEKDAFLLYYSGIYSDTRKEWGSYMYQEGNMRVTQAVRYDAVTDAENPWFMGYQQEAEVLYNGADATLAQNIVASAKRNFYRPEYKAF